MAFKSPNWELLTYSINPHKAQFCKALKEMVERVSRKKCYIRKKRKLNFYSHKMPHSSLQKTEGCCPANFSNLKPSK